MRRIRKWLFALAALPAFAAFFLMTSGGAIGRWTGLELFRYQYQNLNQPNEHTEVIKQEKR